MEYKKIRNISVFTIYLVFVVYVVVFKTDLNILFNNNVQRSVQLEPLYTIKSFYNAYVNGYIGPYFFYSNILGNILIFIPFSFTLYMILNATLSTIISFLFIVSIEFTQWILKIGVFDVDDVILNMIGIIIGLIICKLVFVYRRRHG
ncbi:MAG: hypothetical protein CSB16_00650 [Clostridiales bacterium]|nr:MAG: hypothetical protein CSB16_00650 [Clostridiales bacterium]